MYKWIIVLIFILPNLAMAEKYKQGTLEVGGSVGIGSTSTSGTQIAMSPRVQYFIIDNLAIGLTVDFNKNDNEEELGVGPSATYYLNFTEKFVPFISQTFLYKNYSGPLRDGEDGYYATTAVGLNYPIGPNTAISLAYQKLYSLEGDNEAEESESLVWGIRAFL